MQICVSSTGSISTHSAVSSQAQLRFQRVKAPERAELEQLVYVISERTGRYAERQGLLVRDPDNSCLTLEPAGETGLEGELGSSITYRIAMGPQQCPLNSACPRQDVSRVGAQGSTGRRALRVG